jgi:hypothetical protein
MDIRRKSVPSSLSSSASDSARFNQMAGFTVGNVKIGHCPRSASGEKSLLIL